MSDANDTPPTLPDDEDTQVRSLMPFYVNGSLNSDEHARVDTWMSRSPEQAEELKWFSQLAEAVRSEADAANPQAGLAHLRRRIEADRAAAARQKTVLQRCAEWLRPLLTPPMAVAYGLVLAQAAVLLFYTTREAADHELLRSSRDAAVVLPGPYARVIFAGSADETAIRRFLLRNTLQIVGGPNALGEYWLAHTKGRALNDVAWLADIENEAVIQSAVIDDKAPTSRH